MQNPNKKLTLGIPKGSLQNYTLRVFKGAGFDIQVPPRGYVLQIDDPEIDCYLLRPQEIPQYIEKGQLEAGIAGEDAVFNSGAKIIEVCDLRYAKQKIKRVKWVLAVPAKSDIKSVKDLKGKLISTEMVSMVKDYLKRKNIKARVEFSWGASEVKPPRFADAIVDVTETGASLKAHNLKILDTVFESSTKLFANKRAWQDDWKREKIEGLSSLLQGAVRGEECINLMMHVLERKLRSVLRILPKAKKPTVRKIAVKDWYNVLVSCEAKEARRLIPKLKRLGCEGIVQYPAVKLVP